MRIFVPCNGKSSTKPDKKKSLGDHVKFTKIHNRPYIDAVDLVTSDEFQDAVEADIKILNLPTKKNNDQRIET